MSYLGDASQDEAMRIFNAEQAKLDAKKRATDPMGTVKVIAIAIASVWAYRTFIKK